MYLLAVDRVGDDPRAHPSRRYTATERCRSWRPALRRSHQTCRRQQVAPRGHQGRNAGSSHSASPMQAFGDRITRGKATMTLSPAGRYDPFALMNAWANAAGSGFRARRNGGPTALWLRRQIHAPFLRDAIEQLGLRAVGPDCQLCPPSIAGQYQVFSPGCGHSMFSHSPLAML